MKSILTLLFVGVLLSSANSQGIEIKDYCTLDKNKESVKSGLVPYKVEYSKDYKISLKEYNQMRDFIIDLVYDSPYRLVFNTTGMPQSIQIKIFDRDPENKKAQLLFEKSGNNQYIYDVGDVNSGNRPRKLFVVIYIEATPATSTNLREYGCVNFTYGTLPLYDKH